MELAVGMKFATFLSYGVFYGITQAIVSATAMSAKHIVSRVLFSGTDYLTDVAVKKTKSFLGSLFGSGDG